MNEEERVISPEDISEDLVAEVNQYSAQDHGRIHWPAGHA